MQTTLFYEFGAYRLDAAERILLCEGRPVPLTPKAFETLLVLVERNGSVVERAELLEKVWRDTHVEEQNLTFNISVLRKTLGESSNGRQFIETVPRRGYRFTPEVRLLTQEHHAAPPATHVVATVYEAAGEAATINAQDVAAHTPLTNVTPLTKVCAAEEQNKSETSGDFSYLEESVEDSENLEGLKLEVPEQEHKAPRATSAVAHKRVAPFGIFAREHLSLIVALLLIAFGGILLWYGLNGGRRAQNISASAFQRMQLARLTTLGKVRSAAISPDGKHVVYALEDDGRQSLWLRHVPTASNVQIVQPEDARYKSVAFSPNGDFIYFVRGAENTASALYQMPVFGGATKKIVDRVDSYIAFSPNGKQIAFARSDAARGEDALIIADADGGAEKALVVRKSPDYLSSGGAAWSHDGERIAFAAGNSSTNDMTLLEARLADGNVKPLTTQRWFRIERIERISEDELVMLATPRARFFYQLWHLSYATGEAQRVTNDLNNYSGISLDADARTLLTVRFAQLAHIWVADLNRTGAGEARQVTTGTDNFEGGNGLAWSPDGNLVYSSNTSGDDDIWSVEANGSRAKQLTASSRVNWQPAVAHDNAHVYFLSDRAGAPHVWRATLDGNNPQQVTNAGGETNPELSTDGRWLFYTALRNGEYGIWRAPLDNSSAPVQLTNTKMAIRPAVSPDGKYVAYWEVDAQQDASWKLCVIPSEGGQPIKVFPLAPSTTARGFFGAFFFRVRWMPDGASLAYIDRRGGVSNIWIQPLDGSAPHQLTDFRNDQIFDFAFSHDGKRLAVARGAESSDVVLLNNFR